MELSAQEFGNAPAYAVYKKGSSRPAIILWWLQPQVLCPSCTLVTEEWVIGLFMGYKCIHFFFFLSAKKVVSSSHIRFKMNWATLLQFLHKSPLIPHLQFVANPKYVPVSTRKWNRTKKIAQTQWNVSLRIITKKAVVTVWFSWPPLGAWHTNCVTIKVWWITDVPMPSPTSQKPRPKC